MKFFYSLLLLASFLAYSMQENNMIEKLILQSRLKEEGSDLLDNRKSLMARLEEGSQLIYINTHFLHSKFAEKEKLGSAQQSLYTLVHNELKKDPTHLPYVIKLSNTIVCYITPIPYASDYSPLCSYYFIGSCNKDIVHNYLEDTKN